MSNRALIQITNEISRVMLKGSRCVFMRLIQKEMSLVGLKKDGWSTAKDSHCDVNVQTSVFSPGTKTLPDLIMNQDSVLNHLSMGCKGRIQSVSDEFLRVPSQANQRLWALCVTEDLAFSPTSW